MADTTVTDKQVADLATILRSDSNLDVKVQHVTDIKSGIKQHNVPDSCVAPLFDSLRTASSAQHAALVNAGFTALNHLLTRLSRQEPKLLTREAPRTLPLVIEKLGDTKDKFRSLATQALTTLYGVAPADVERFVRSSALSGKNPRAKEAALHWLLQTHQEQGLQFRSYVPLLMELLEDADGMVRDAAKSTVIELFRNASNAAKSDLKRQLKNFKVRSAIEQAIVKELAPTSSTRPETPAEPAAAPSAAKPAFGASVSSMSSDRPITPSVDPKNDNIEPRYVNTNRELDDIFKEMAWFFEGRESEQNWVKREESMGTLRKLNAGNAPTDFHDSFLTGLRGMLDGIIKSMNSLRTSLSKEGCGLVQDIAMTFGPGIDPMVELLMQTLVKMSAGTKKISQQLANSTVEIILGRVSYSQRLLQHIWGACQDKNVSPRTFATSWLKTLLKKEAHHKNHIEHTGGVDVIEKCIKKGLADPNPSVRERMRSTYWAFWAIWPARADGIMADLDTTAQKLLNKDASNPNSPKKADAPRPGLGMSKSTMSSKPSLREAMMAQKKATLAVKNNLPARPGSAMAHISPERNVRTASGSSNQSATAKSSGTTRTRPESTTAGGMSGAPMRPMRRRPELAARPATAGPYSMRDQPASMEADSPESHKAKLATPRTRDAVTPKRPATAARPRPGHASHASESSVPSPTARAAAKHGPASPRTSPGKLKHTQSAVAPGSPSKTKSPSKPISKSAPPTQPHPEPEAETSPASPPPSIPQITLDPQPEDAPVKSLEVYEDPFTQDQVAPARPIVAGAVLEEKPVNEDAAALQQRAAANGHSVDPVAPPSPEKTRQNARLLDSGITKIKAKSLEVHGFRKLQSLLRDKQTITFTDDKFEALLLGLFAYLEDPLESTAADKAQDVKAQILATIKLLLRTQRDNFHPHVSKGLESLLQTRASYDTRAHIVSGLELLATELVALGDASEIVVVLTRRLQGCSDASVEGCRSLSMGLHVLKEMLDRQVATATAAAAAADNGRGSGNIVALSNGDLERLATLAARCLDSADSGVRMDAVQMCVALHARVGEDAFWEAVSGVKDDPKSLITYYIVKRQRELGNSTGAGQQQSVHVGSPKA